MIEFRPLREFNRGIIFDMLMKSYEKVLQEMPRDKKNIMVERWRQNDKDAFDNLDTIGNCYFVTCDDGKVVGFGSYDPRQEPEIGKIGDNIVQPEFRGKGYGKMQIQEILRIFTKKWPVKKVVVSTGANDFFIPAQKQYLSCGFKEVKRFIEDGDEQICYELNIIK